MTTAYKAGTSDVIMGYCFGESSGFLMWDDYNPPFFDAVAETVWAGLVDETCCVVGTAVEFRFIGRSGFPHASVEVVVPNVTSKVSQSHFDLRLIFGSDRSTRSKRFILSSLGFAKGRPCSIVF